MNLYFVTGNANKFAEARLIIPGLKQLDIDVPEIQEIDPHKIIEAKLTAARIRQSEGAIVVEDVGLYLDALNGLPGPLIKWFLKTMGAKGLADITQHMSNAKAKAVALLGYMSDDGTVKFFEGEAVGTIVSPRGDTNFGWDSIFQPEGYTQTYAEMGIEEKNKISHRRKAFEKLATFLNSSK